MEHNGRVTRRYLFRLCCSNPEELGFLAFRKSTVLIGSDCSDYVEPVPVYVEIRPIHSPVPKCALPFRRELCITVAAFIDHRSGAGSINGRERIIQLLVRFQLIVFDFLDQLSPVCLWDDGVIAGLKVRRKHFELRLICRDHSGPFQDHYRIAPHLVILAQGSAFAVHINQRPVKRRFFRCFFWLREVAPFLRIFFIRERVIHCAEHCAASAVIGPKGEEPALELSGGSALLVILRNILCKFFLRVECERLCDYPVLNL